MYCAFLQCLRQSLILSVSVVCTCRIMTEPLKYRENQSFFSIVTVTNKKSPKDSYLNVTGSAVSKLKITDKAQTQFQGLSCNGKILVFKANIQT